MCTSLFEYKAKKKADLSIYVRDYFHFTKNFNAYFY